MSLNHLLVREQIVNERTLIEHLIAVRRPLVRIRVTLEQAGTQILHDRHHQVSQRVLQRLIRVLLIRVQNLVHVLE